MNYTVPITAAFVLAAVVTAGVVYAQPGGRGGPLSAFEEMDVNGDGQVTQEEMQAHRQARFAQIDTNGDGALSLDELTANGVSKAADRASRMLERFDANGDGVLSAEELPQQRRGGKMFERADANGDGMLSAEEYAEVSEKMHKRGKHKRHDAETDQN